MAKNVSAIVSGMGAGLSILQGLTEKARKRGCSDEDIHRLATPDGDSILDRFADFLAEATAKAKDLFRVTVDYDRTVEEMVKAGKYDWADSDVTSKHFPANRRGIVEAEVLLMHFNRYIRSEEALCELDKMGLRPAELPGLLAFGATYPEKQREFPIVALGSVWQRPDGYRLVPPLCRRSSRRGLGLLWFGRGWRSVYRFAAVRK